MLCPFGYKTAPGWHCLVSSWFGHKHRNNDIDIIFFADKTTRAITFNDTHGQHLEWDCQGDPIFYIGHSLDSHLFMVSNINGHQNDCQKCGQRILGDYTSIVVRAPGFYYSFGGMGLPLVELHGEKLAELTNALRILPIPIANAIAKQFPIFTPESWRRDFAKKYPREQYTDGVLASRQFIL